MIAVFGDLHGNAEALRQALPGWNGAKARIYLGDSVGYRRHPEEAVRLVSQHSDIALLGNHDAAGCGMFDEFLELLPAWLARTILDTEELPEDLWEWLASRRPKGQWEGIELVHGSLRDPLMEFLTPEVAWEHLEMQRSALSLAGHTHRPLALGMGDDLLVWEPRPDNPVLDLGGAEKWALNPGSLGIGEGTWLSLHGAEARWHWLG